MSNKASIRNVFEITEVKEITFCTLFDEMVERIIAIDKLPEIIEDASEKVLFKLINQEIHTFIDSLSLSQVAELKKMARQLLCGESSEIFDGESYIQEEDEVLAVYIMTHNTPKLCDTSDSGLNRPLSMYKHSISRSEDNEETLWRKIYKDLWSYGALSKTNHLFLIRVICEDTTDYDAYSLYTTNDKTTAKEALYRIAQLYLGGEADVEQGCFTYEATKQYPNEASLINTEEFNAYKKLNIRVYEELDSIAADMGQVDQFYEDFCVESN